MKKRLANGLHIVLIGILIHFYGCIPPKPAPPFPGPTAEVNIARGAASEENGNLAQALYFYKVAAGIYEKKTKETYSDVSRVSKKMNQAQKYIDKAIVYINKGRCVQARKYFDDAFAIRRDHPKAGELKRMIQNCKEPNTTPPSPLLHLTGCIVLKGKQYDHIVKPGDQLGELCQRVYGQTGRFKLVHAIVKYNKMNPNDLKRGQRIKFPAIKCKNNTYYPSFPDKPAPPPIPTTTPVPTPPPVDTEEAYKHEHYSRGVEHLKNERFGEAKYEFDLVSQKDADYLDVTQKMEEATLGGMIKDGRHLFDTAQYDKAIELFKQVSGLQKDNRTAVEYLHKAYFEKAVNWYKGRQLSKALTNFEKCFHYYDRCHECRQYKKRDKRAILSQIAASLEKQSKHDISKNTLQQLVKALKLLRISVPDNRDVNRRLEDAPKLLDGFK